MDLARGLDEVLQVGAEEEVTEVDEFAMVLIFDIDHTPAVLAATDLATVDSHGSLGTDNGEGNEALLIVSRA